ncbi:MAG: YbhB/YbcL family Raf kinase inhibitor-like protein [Bacteroidia bacterium]|nr:YbhB/YbcL family Raf kinase inhibitor-like protein [Bacteroidia bacterium]MDW8134142.1 YbhB/YbcL family Raf kinase inhibitor-like protein [Bacteroidia bacterium]
MRYFLLLSSLGWAQWEVIIEGYKKGDFLSVEHTCDGGDIPLTIRWKGSPSNTQAYVVRMYDPDAPADTFTHWLIYNFTGQEITPHSKGLAQGYNDFGRAGYGGPCPPPRDEAHRYVIEVYALRKPIQIQGPATWEKIRAAIADKVIAHTETYVRYKRQRR